jgi:hypothetical protein
LMTVPKTLEIHSMNECPRVFHCTYMLWKFQIYNIYMYITPYFCHVWNGKYFLNSCNVFISINL